MSIPDRFYRIAKYKLGEIKDWFDKVDEEEEGAGERRSDPRPDAGRELNDALSPSGNARDNASSSIPVNPPRTPQEIARGLRPTLPTTSGYSTGNTGSGMSSSSSSTGTQPDPLDYHYKLLGLEPGADFAAVQAAYNKLAARSDPGRFPAGSQEEQAARQIRQRLETSYKQLRETLDTTAARFGLLEF